MRNMLLIITPKTQPRYQIHEQLLPLFKFLTEPTTSATNYVILSNRCKLNQFQTDKDIRQP